MTGWLGSYISAVVQIRLTAKISKRLLRTVLVGRYLPAHDFAGAPACRLRCGMSSGPGRRYARFPRKSAKDYVLHSITVLHNCMLPG